MSDNQDIPHVENENLDTGQTSYSIDDEDQLQQEDTLVQDGTEDALDAGYSPPDQPRAANSWGTTPYEQAHEETIDQRIEQEVPDPHSAAGAPLNESGLDQPEQGDFPDSQRATDQGFTAPDREVGDERSGRLVAPDEGGGADTEEDMVGDDVGISGGAASAEEAAVHTMDEEP